MIYLLIIYAVFSVVWDNWAPDTVRYHIIYNVFTYLWVASVAVIYAQKGRYYLFAYSFALIMIITSLIQFSSWNIEKSAYELSKAPPGITWFNVAVLILLIISLIRWTGLKRIFGRLYWWRSLQ